MDKVQTDGEAVNLGAVVDPTRTVRLPDRPWILRCPGAPDPLAIPCAVVGVEARALCPVFSTRDAGVEFVDATKCSCRPLPEGTYVVRLTRAQARRMYVRAKGCGIVCILDVDPLPARTTWN